MKEHELREMLARVQRGECLLDDAVRKLRKLPFEDLGDVCFDHQRELRSGLGEVVFAEGKSTDQLCNLLRKLGEGDSPILVSRLRPEQMERIRSEFPFLRIDEEARMAERRARSSEVIGTAAVLCAGTSDLPVASEAHRSLEHFGVRSRLYPDRGVAGLPRLLAIVEDLRECDVVIAVAGMEGALPGVVAGLVPCPIIAVPTSIGYGASFQGLAALFGMLTACSLGLSVVNIDNGVGAAAAAAKWIRHLRNSRELSTQNSVMSNPVDN